MYIRVFFKNIFLLLNICYFYVNLSFNNKVSLYILSICCLLSSVNSTVYVLIHMNMFDFLKEIYANNFDTIYSTNEETVIKMVNNMITDYGTYFPNGFNGYTIWPSRSQAVKATLLQKTLELRKQFLDEYIKTFKDKKQLPNISTNFTITKIHKKDNKNQSSIEVSSDRLEEIKDILHDTSEYKYSFPPQITYTYTELQTNNNNNNNNNNKNKIKSINDKHKDFMKDMNMIYFYPGSKEQLFKISTIMFDKDNLENSKFLYNDKEILDTYLFKSMKKINYNNINIIFKPGEEKFKDIYDDKFKQNDLYKNQSENEQGAYKDKVDRNNFQLMYKAIGARIPLLAENIFNWNNESIIPIHINENQIILSNVDSILGEIKMKAQGETFDDYLQWFFGYIHHNNPQTYMDKFQNKLNHLNLSKINMKNNFKLVNITLNEQEHKIITTYKERTALKKLKELFKEHINVNMTSENLINTIKTNFNKINISLSNYYQNNKNQNHQSGGKKNKRKQKNI